MLYERSTSRKPACKPFGLEAGSERIMEWWI
jgi:hypothetical protein